MMKGETMLGAKRALTFEKKQSVLTPPDLGQKQRLFADALTKAEGKPVTNRRKMAEDQPVGGAVMAPITYAATIAAAPLPPPADATMAAHIERIAAAIAEVTSSGAKAEIQIQLPPGATRLDGAIIGRNDAGQLHIVLTTAAAITPAASAQLQSQLTERLLRRDIRVAKMNLQRVSRRG